MWGEGLEVRTANRLWYPSADSLCRLFPPTLHFLQKWFPCPPICPEISLCIGLSDGPEFVPKTNHALVPVCTSRTWTGSLWVDLVVLVISVACIWWKHYTLNGFLECLKLSVPWCWCLVKWIRSECKIPAAIGDGVSCEWSYMCSSVYSMTLSSFWTRHHQRNQ
jgi:hypothetical protein